MSDQPIQSRQIMHTDLLGNMHPMKVDRNLQCKSHLPNQSNILPCTIRDYDLIKCLVPRTAPPGHTVQTHIPKRCVLAI